MPDAPSTPTSPAVTGTQRLAAPGHRPSGVPRRRGLSRCSRLRVIRGTLSRETKPP
jgi:hypothetical protein